MEIFWLLLGFIMILVASNVLVDAASSIALKLRVPKMLVALTIVAFGTCAPEVAISFQSVEAANGHCDFFAAHFIFFKNRYIMIFRSINTCC